MPFPEWRAQLAIANGDEDRARAIAAGITQHHRDNFGGRRGTKRLAAAEVAKELNITVEEIGEILARARLPPVR
ncbi:hypothetical protein AB0J63_38765 [Streptosporangium canum]|uniref:hypothetical protein n=1 Tax=Streptosporangium canum TaxID=324952 RepID=UPI0034496691